MKYKIHCPICKNQILDSVQYVKEVYKDGTGTKIHVKCPACHSIFKYEEERHDYSK